ncbi:hypothetical protein L226DRAFT_525768 [Lentinus tigrinus ALCF2SS1-7]|uniref:uncharacterized protein n=1 Tax=Lentinus tigrinus ALCF2SS1-7 TaxID=1328758 RepID=UPI0011661201|nr:hypothetical protein L226DRAFT_525768 [Lentinus tigrinus ALCF2SS1-7]
MLVAPSPVARSSPRLPSADHRLTIPEGPSLASRRHSSLSPLHGSRPHRSSPLAGPSIALSHDGTLKATSAPPTPGGGGRHLSPLAEFSTTAAQVEDPGDDADSKKRRRRSLGAVLSKMSFPSSASSTGAEPASPERESQTPVRPRQRSKSANSRTTPPVPAVPPVPAWAHNTAPARSMSPHKLSPSSSRSQSHAQSPGSSGSPKSSRPSSPTPSARSNPSRRSVIQTPTGSPVSARAIPSTSRNPEENWLTQSSAPRFSRLGLKAEGVILPVSVREARRRSTASTLSLASRAKPSDALSPHPRPGSSSSRSSTAGHASSNRMSIASTSTFTPSSVSHSHSSHSHSSHSHSSHSHSTPASASASASGSPPRRHRSRASSSASVSSSLDCDTPSLTMSPGPSASDISLAPEPPSVIAVDEMGVLTMTTPSVGVGVQLQLNDVPVGVIGIPDPDVSVSAYPAIPDKGKGRARNYDLDVDYGMQVLPPLPLLPVRADDTASSIASIGSIGSIASERSVFTVPVPWTRGAGAGGSVPASPSGSERSSYFGPAMDLPRARHERAATAPGAGAGGERKTDKAREKEGLKKRTTIGRMWKQVVRSVTGDPYACSTATALNEFQSSTPGVALEDDEEITHLVHKLEEALSDIKYYPFSSATDVAMKKAGIVRTPHSSPLEHYKLTDPVTFAKHAARYRVMCAESAFLSADNFYAVYDAIVRHVSLNTEAGSRMLIDAFLLRVAAMVDNGHLLVFPEYVVPMIELCGPGDKFHVGGKLDYLLVLLLEEEKDSAAPLLKEPTTLEPDSTGFAIVEAKLPAYPTLSDALPQALLEVAAFAKKYNTSTNDQFMLIPEF